MLYPTELRAQGEKLRFTAYIRVFGIESNSIFYVFSLVNSGQTPAKCHLLTVQLSRWPSENWKIYKSGKYKSRSQGESYFS